MDSKVLIHSEGMISVNADDKQPTEASIEFVKGTKLYQELVDVLGKKHALATVEDRVTPLPTDAGQPLPSLPNQK